MTFLQAIILGIVQGITEFLPISSSGHLVLTSYLFGWEIPKDQVFQFDVLVQIGTILAVIVYFWKDINCILSAVVLSIWHRNSFDTSNARLGWYIFLSTIPAGFIGLTLATLVEKAFHSPVATACFLLVTAILLLIAEFLGKRNRSIHHLGWKDALWIGIFQSLAIFPGISRSGATIAGGMTRHLQRWDAARFSFLMSIPIMLAAGLVSLLDLLNAPPGGNFLPVLLTGFLTATIVGYFSIHWLLSFLNKRPLKIFAIYCLGLGMIILLINYVT